MAADFNFKKSRKSNFSPEEIEALVTTVQQHYSVLYGQYAKRFTNKEARNAVWLNVLHQVNQVSIEKRTLQEVKNKWKKCQHLYRDPDMLDYSDDLVNVWEPLATIEDSMPLQQRLTETAPQESQKPVLQSQPLSPTKLKVTRQAAKPPQISPKPPTPEPPNEEVCLRWNSHHANMQTAFPGLLLREQYVDATLVAEGKTLKCHKMILSSCSPYFEEVLNGISPFQHPVLFLKDIPFWILKSLCDFMYAGEVHIFQNKLEELLAVAEALKIKGLAGKTDNNEDTKPVVEPLKEEKEPVKEERKKEDKKKHHQQQAKEETPKVVLSPKVISTPKVVSKPSTSKSSHSKKPEKHKEKEKIVEKTIPMEEDDDIIDPLDLLEPVYEEEVKKDRQQIAQVKNKESKHVPVKKNMTKKVKKRRFPEEKEESPPPVFHTRKGTRSRPNVKIPKYFHSHYEAVPKDSPDPTIVREPHTDQNDPLIQVEEIKAEPIDVEDDVIEIEDNMVSFSDQDMTSQDSEEIIGNYDSPIVNLKENILQDNNKDTFKKITLVPQPVIMNVHTVGETSTDTLKIVDIRKIGAQESNMPEENLQETVKNDNDPLTLASKSTRKTETTIMISNVESVADSNEDKREETSVNEDRGLSFRIENVISACTEDISKKDEENKEQNEKAGVAKETKTISVSSIEYNQETGKAAATSLLEASKESFSSSLEEDKTMKSNKEMPILSQEQEENKGVNEEIAVSSQKHEEIKGLNEEAVASQDDSLEVAAPQINKEPVASQDDSLGGDSSQINEEPVAAQDDSLGVDVLQINEEAVASPDESLEVAASLQINKEIAFSSQIQINKESEQSKECNEEADVSKREIGKTKEETVEDLDVSSQAEDTEKDEETDVSEGEISKNKEETLEDMDVSSQVEDTEKDEETDVSEREISKNNKDETLEDMDVSSQAEDTEKDVDDRIVDENKLLELDEDILMAEDGVSEKPVENEPEKTLEMIVNDLNESLAESSRGFQETRSKEQESNMTVETSVQNIADDVL